MTNQNTDNRGRITDKGIARYAVLIAGLALALAACSPTVLSLDVGTCFDDWDDITTQQEVTELPTVDCAEPHDNEVYSKFQMNDGSFPGTDRATDIAIEECEASFEPYVGTPYLDSSLDFGWLIPTQESWDEANDREIICFLYDLQLNELTGSMKGSGI